ncbi:uncharacterized protein [Antedon mediterranea]|uniref:uncharacterized protein n=1 Tax=Antedon mediterranea TaxID=105859 RepID=UPI003AF61417
MAENEITSADMTNDSLPNNKRDEEDQKEVNESKDSPTTAEFFVTTDADTEDKNIKENNTAMKSVGETENLSERPISDVFKEDDNVILPIENQTLARLSDGFLQKIQPELDCFNNSFQELTRNQRVLMETVQQENSKFSENKDIKDLADMASKIDINCNKWYPWIFQIKLKNYHKPHFHWT